MVDFKLMILTLPASWEAFWRMIALIVTDTLGETSSRFDPLVKLICQGCPVQSGSVVRTPSDALLTNTDVPRFPPAPSPLRPDDEYVFAQIDQCLVSFCTRADSRHTTIGNKFS